MSKQTKWTENWASYSQLTRHRSCPQSWQYGYVRRLSKIDPDDVKVEMHFGSFWHMLLAADSLVRGRSLGSLQFVPEKLTCVDDGPTLLGEGATPTAVLDLAEIWWKGQTPLTQETWVARIGQDLPNRLVSLYNRWQVQWAKEISTEEPLAVEMGWKRNLPVLPGTEEGSVVEPDTTLIGYIDEAYFDTKRHMVVVRDHKSQKSLGTQSTADDMMDSQLQLYAWGASPMVTEWGRGPIRATAYDRARMVKAKTPVVTQAGSLSKSITDFDLTTYLEWAQGEDGMGVPFPGRLKDGSAAGLYQAEPEMIEKLSTPAAATAWFQRTLAPLNGNLIKVHLRSAVDTASALAATKARATATQEAARNLTSNCRWCDFVGLCRAEMVGGVDGEYDLTDFRLVQRLPHS